MNYSFKLSRAVFALAGAALGASSLQAATVAAPAIGDLFLGVRASGGQGAAVSYIANIGSDLAYRNAAAGTSADVSALGGIGADLAATYGANWATRADLHWSIFGARQSVNSTLYASREQNPAGTLTLAWPELTQTARNATATSIIDVISGIGGYSGSESTANSSVAVWQANSGSASSYYNQVAALGTTDFGSLSQWTSVEGDFGGGASGTALDLYRIAGSGVTLVGTFSLSGSGVLHFTTPVPEPGTFMFGAVALAFGLRRRRASLLSETVSI